MTAKAESVQAAGGPGRVRQAAIFRAGALGRMPSIPTDAPSLERRAKKAMSRTAWAYVAGGAGEGRTMRHNRESFERWGIVPRMLRGTPQRDLRTSVVGTQLSAPVLLAPIGAASIVVPNSDVITAEGAAATGTAYVISCQGCNPLEETAAAMNPWPFWYQLYWSTDEALVDSMISRAEQCGAGALVVTLDTTILGWRPQDLNLGSLPFCPWTRPRPIHIGSSLHPDRSGSTWISHGSSQGPAQPRRASYTGLDISGISRLLPRKSAIRRAASRRRGIPRYLLKPGAVLGSHCHAPAENVVACRAERDSSSR